MTGLDPSTPLNQSGGGETSGRNSENLPDTRGIMDSHISALKELLKQPSNHDLIKPMLLDFSDEIHDTDEEDREAERVNVSGKAVVANKDLGKPFKEVLKCPFTRIIIEFSAPKHKMQTNMERLGRGLINFLIEASIIGESSKEDGKSLTSAVSAILVLSHVFQIFLKPLGQPAPLAQILAGLVLGPSGLSRAPSIHVFFFQNFAIDFYESMALYCRISIMFLIGLEMDIPYLRRNFREASIIACSGCLMCTLFAAAISYFVYEETGSRGSHFTVALVITVILANTASPIVFRLAADLKFATSDIGRLAISSSVIGDMYAVFILVIISGEKHKRTVTGWALMAGCSLLLLVGIIICTKHLVNWLNKRNRDEKNLQAVEVMLLCSVILVTAMILETMGFSSIIACFLMGSMFPRGGKSARTLLAILTYTVHNFIFPIYFGYTGFKADTSYLNELKRIGIVSMVIVLSIGGKIFGTLAACRYLKTPLNEGVLLAFLMNMKGHVDILTLTTAMQNKVLNSSIFYNLMVSAVVISSLISAALIGFLVRRESDTIGIRHIPMEFHSPEKELKLVACVHSRHIVSCMVRLILSLRGSDNVPISPYLMHLIELPGKPKKNKAFDEQEEDESSDDEDFGRNDVVEINEAIDLSTEETKMMIHQVQTVAPFKTMYQDVCDFADDVRASFIVLPFHKHQRIDGKFENDKDGVRTTNQKVLRHAQCSVALLVHRGHDTIGTQAAGSESLQQIATLFFGGPDDREALGFSKRLSTHHHSSLTIIRFLPTSARDPNVGINVSQKEDDVLVAIDHETEIEEADSSYLANFYHRYVTSGKVRFLEKYVENGAQTGMILRDMAKTYALFIVGKGGRGDSLLTTGISDWEECPELGVVVKLLAGYDISPLPFLALVEDSQNFTEDTLHGVNFASGGAGVDKTIGQEVFGQVISFEEQIQQFATVQGNITALLGESKADLLLQDSTYIISIGSNDVMTYIFNKSTTPELFIASLTDAFAVHLKDLYNLGARKFGILSIPPIGCCPIARSASGGSCDEDTNKLASAFYTSFEFRLQNLSSTLEGFKYSLGNTFNMTMNIINKPIGFKDVKSACCGTKGPLGLSDCKEGLDLCPDRDDYLFWDAFHPTQKASILAAQVLVFSQDQNFVAPVNFKSLRYA
uniref:Cation/H(+) antiporter 2-like n=1 Tax=Tanacetum cinerariifolium TaxID=118510 RepID=A0A6L2KKM7_TANCI|nr:cation/H(+) antiporter 2-like [Tanacetum cinerariifolium]